MAKILVGIVFATALLHVVHGLQTISKESLAAGSTKNVCVDDHIAPELFFIGGPRCSTTTFYQNFAQSPNAVFGKCHDGQEQNFLASPRTVSTEASFVNFTACNRGKMKEMHFFNGGYEEGPDATARYLSHYPACQNEERIVAADLTPNHHTMHAVPERIAQMYGNQAKQLKFLAFLRNPIDQLHSFYYYENQNSKHSFQDYVQSILRAHAKGSLNYGRYVINANIASGIQNFLNIFDPAQIYIVPFAYNTQAKNGLPRVHEFVMKMLGMQPSSTFEEVEVAPNTKRYPTLAEDLDQATREQFGRLLDSLSGSSVIAEIIAANKGLNLYGFQGNSANVMEIKDWIDDGW